MLLNEFGTETHLTYCTNVHPGEELSDLRRMLGEHVAPVKARVSPDAPFGVGLRIAPAASRALKEPEARAGFAAALEETGAYLFTINGFPYGDFHGRRVKEDVYAPDWSTPERLAYTNELADVLAALMPDDLAMGSISTVPGTFKGWATPERVQAMSANLIAHAAHLVDLERRTGRFVALALEPEPCCYLETIDEALAYFREHLFSDAAAAALGALTGLPAWRAEEALRRHLGLCYDVCHAAVEYEDPADNFARLRAAGITVPKIQLSSALRIPAMDRDAAAALGPFAEPVYLHQVVERRDGGFARHLDLPQALQHLDEALGREWRVHFHVPVFMEDLPAFSTTQDVLRQVLALQKEMPVAPHLEIETYTWDVLPPELRAGGVNEAIAREIGWVRRELAA